MRGLLVGLVLVTVTAGSPALAERRDQGDLGEQERALQHKQKQLREERARATEARGREASLLAELEGTERRIAEKRRQVGVLDARVKRTRAEVAGLEREMARLEQQRSGQEDALARRLRLLYMLPSQGAAHPAGRDEPPNQSSLPSQSASTHSRSIVRVQVFPLSVRGASNRCDG